MNYKKKICCPERDTMLLVDKYRVSGCLSLKH